MNSDMTCFHLQVSILPDISLQSQYELQDTLNPYEQKINSLKNWCCPSCYKSFDMYTDLVTHVNFCFQSGGDNKLANIDVHVTSNNEGMFSCNICSYSSHHKQNVQKHLKIHTGERPFACPLCSYRGTQKHHLENHMKTHTGEKVFSCQLCDYTTAWKSCLKNHFLSKH